jgi:hypothetical protein
VDRFADTTPPQTTNFEQHSFSSSKPLIDTAAVINAAGSTLRYSKALVVDEATSPACFWLVRGLVTSPAT